jgi:hypothetical protein
MRFMETTTGKRQLALKALSIVGFIAVLIFGVWGLIQVARMVPGVFQSLQSAAVSLSSIFVPAERLEVSMSSANVKSGEQFTFSWTHTNKRDDGSYQVSFDCRDGVSMQAPDSHGAYQTVFCNTPFNLTNEMSSMKLIAFSQSARYVDVPMKLAFTRTKDGEVTASTQTSITIENDKLSSGAATSTPTTTPKTTPSANTGRIIKKAGTETRNVYTVTTTGRVSNPNGRMDLSVTILGTGVIDPATNIFTQTASIPRGGKGAVRFVVENLGDKTVPNWYFNAVTPTYPMYIYTSDMQPALGPGDKIEYTLGFDMADAAATGGMLTINLDPANSFPNEITENNNITRAVFQIYQ